VEALSLNPGIAVDQALAVAAHDVSRQDSWLFTYGAMLEDPPFDPVDRQIVACLGWRRAFCLSDPKLRGTPQHPGLTLGLVKSDQCVGVAWRLPAQTVRRDLSQVFAAELKLPFYSAAWLPIRSPNGHATALALVADTAGPLFEPHLSNGEVARRIAACRGPKGANADYLHDVVSALDRAGVADLYLNRLWSCVEKWTEPTEANSPNGRP
jgi:glutathione-specific gamma-glutamylcyclotransferase